MRLALFATVITLVGGCNSSRSDTPAGSTASSPAASTAEPSNRDALQTITLVGCLQASPGRPTNAAEPGLSTVASDVAGHFTLVNATPAGPTSAGVGTQGAGASGGPLVSGRTSYELDALPTNARDAVNKQVEITGRLDTASAVAASSNPVPATGDGPARLSESPRASSGNDSTGVPQHESAAPSLRRVVVDSVKVVGEACAAGSD